MAQATGITYKNCKVEISTDNSAWTDISGYANSVEVGGGDVEVKANYAISTRVPLLYAGNKNPVEITVKAIYTEGGSDPFTTAFSAYVNTTALYLRFTPQGLLGTSGKTYYVTQAGYVKKSPIPSGSAGDNKLMLFELQLVTQSLSKGTFA